jgi:hypothetical protein
MESGVRTVPSYHRFAESEFKIPFRSGEDERTGKRKTRRRAAAEQRCVLFCEL